MPFLGWLLYAGLVGFWSHLKILVGGRPRRQTLLKTAKIDFISTF
jgi:hypothetical protein